jgi:hypothetical protein
MNVRGPLDQQPDEPGWWMASDGKWYPPESAAPAELVPSSQSSSSNVQSTGFVLTIGDIGITPSVVVTPNGNAPLAGSQWIAMDMSRTETRIPSWAIVLAVIFAFACLLGLLFLLVREQTTTGYIEVSVRSGDLYHRTQIPVFDQAQIMHARQLVNQAQTLAAQAR